MHNSLEDGDFLWLAERVHEYRVAMQVHTRWSRWFRERVDGLIWVASVNGVVDGQVQKDAWVRSGGALKKIHFERVPHTQRALDAFTSGELTSIKREHIVPRAKVVKILMLTCAVPESLRVLRDYARVALVHDDEVKLLSPSRDMPAGWDNAIDWTSNPLPAQLPSAWARFAALGVDVWNPDGSRAF